MTSSVRSLSVAELVASEKLQLSVRAGQEGLKRLITTPEINRPAMELLGFTQEFRPERMQVIGRGESTYILEHVDYAELRKHYRNIFAPETPCVVVTHGRQLPDWCYEVAKESGVPFLETPHPTSRFVLRAFEKMEGELAPRVVERGVLMDIFGTGVLIAGQSGVGKSECALELVNRGHTFVADDIIEIHTHQDSSLIGTGRSFLPHHMEIRGIGIIDVHRLYGPSATRKEKQINLVVTLEDWNSEVEYDRLGIDEATVTILDVEIPAITVPVRPGRNLSTIIEVAALNQKMKSEGVFMAREFEAKLIESLTRRGHKEDEHDR